jgi:hypothetical protein
VADKVKLNHKEIDRILKGQTGNVAQVLEGYAQRIVDATGNPEDYEIETWVGATRVRVSVETASRAAAVREAQDHTLIRALGAVSG